MLESTDSKQVASSHIALAAHKTVNPLQKLQDNLRGGPSWQPQPSQAEHSLRGAPLVSAEKQQDLSPPGGGTAQPDASRFMPSIQPPPPASVGAAAVPGVGFEGIQSTLSTMAPPLHVGAAPQHVAAAIEETCQPAQSRGGAPDMGRLAASRPLPQRPVESKQPAAAQVLQQRAPSPDGSAQPGQWRTKHRTAAPASLQHESCMCCTLAAHARGVLCRGWDKAGAGFCPSSACVRSRRGGGHARQLCWQAMCSGGHLTG